MKREAANRENNLIGKKKRKIYKQRRSKQNIRKLTRYKKNKDNIINETVIGTKKDTKKRTIIESIEEIL